MRDHGFGRRFERLEAIVQEELQGVVQILKGCLGPYDKVSSGRRRRILA